MIVVKIAEPPNLHERDTVLDAVKDAARRLRGGPQEGPSLTTSARDVTPPWQVGTKKRPSGRTKKLHHEDR
jgi:hypothetical protein